MLADTVIKSCTKRGVFGVCGLRRLLGEWVPAHRVALSMEMLTAGCSQSLTALPSSALHDGGMAAGRLTRGPLAQVALGCWKHGECGWETKFLTLFRLN